VSSNCTTAADSLAFVGRGTRAGAVTTLSPRFLARQRLPHAGQGSASTVGDVNQRLTDGLDASVYHRGLDDTARSCARCTKLYL